MRTIGYYVHHHGNGHRDRAFALAAEAPTRVVLLGTGLADQAQGLRILDLPDDRMVGDGVFDGIDSTSSRPSTLHYAPLRHSGVRARMGTIAHWLAHENPALIVVDVSVEVAMLARLCTIPTAYIRLSGHRNDPAHKEAYRAASLLIAPYSSKLESVSTPKWVRDKTSYCPGIVSRIERHTELVPRTVLIVAGRGGTSLTEAKIFAAAKATPDYRWRIIGPVISHLDKCPTNLEFVGWTDGVAREIATAEVVVGAAGDGLVNAVLAAGRPFICFPEPRPFDEQAEKARALQAAGAAIILDRWPEPGRWQSLLSQARFLDPAVSLGLSDPRGASNTVRKLLQFADT